MAEAYVSIERTDVSQILAALGTQIVSVILEALQDHPVALLVEFSAEALEVRRAGIVTALASGVLRGTERGRQRHSDREHRDKQSDP